MDSCVFCKIVKGELKSQKVYEDENVIAFLDINPIHKGHTLVISKKHYDNIYEIPEEELEKLIVVVKKVAIAIKKLGADGVNIVQNNDEAAGQRVFHIHFHVVPRYHGDKIKIDTIEDRTRYKDEAEMRDYAEKIRRFLV
ncbi:HIT family protein [Stygiolobus caldivivus]|nr:HIT family protein [Stygiolobus caldivivus]